VHVLNVVAGRHVEIVLQHIDTLVVLRKYGRHFSVAVRTPAKWKVTLCDPIWQVTLRSCEIIEMEFH